MLEIMSLEELVSDAEDGDGYAQLALGYMYEEGDEVPRDLSLAMKWFHRAAERGVEDAMCELGRMYYYGKGTPRDLSEAFGWFMKAAELDHPVA